MIKLDLTLWGEVRGEFSIPAEKQRREAVASEMEGTISSKHNMAQSKDQKEEDEGQHEER